MDEVTNLTTFARYGIYKLIREGRFPKQVQIGRNRVAWVESEVLEWIEHKMAQRNATSG